MKLSRPHCYNRAPFTDPLAGWHETQWRQLRPTRAGVEISKPVYRYRYPWFQNRCATWDGVGIKRPGEPADDNGTLRYPVAFGFDCAGCRWLGTVPDKLLTGSQFERGKPE